MNTSTTHRLLRITIAATLLSILMGWQPFTNPPQAKAASQAKPMQQATRLYTVRSGDTLALIAQRFNTTIAAIMQLNGIADPNLIYPGQVLSVPGGQDAEQSLVRLLTVSKDGTPTTVSDLIVYPNRTCFLTDAQANQQMTVQISSPENLVNFLVQAVDRTVNGGLPIKGWDNPQRVWSGSLPAAGDYLICVGAQTVSSTYTLMVTLNPASGGSFLGSVSSMFSSLFSSNSSQPTPATPYLPISPAPISPAPIAPAPVVPVYTAPTPVAPLYAAPTPIAPAYVPPTVPPVTQPIAPPIAAPVYNPPAPVQPAAPSYAPQSSAGSVRVQFPPGQNRVTYSDTVVYPQQKCYVFAGFRGMEMTVQLSSLNNLANFQVTAANMSLAGGAPLKSYADPARAWVGHLTVNTDYTVCVAAPTGVVNYTLTLIDPPAEDPPEPMQMRFSPGSQVSTVTGNVSGGRHPCYLVQGFANQILAIELNSPNNIADISVINTALSLSKRAEPNRMLYAARLPATQNYTFCVNVPENAPVLKFTIGVALMQ